MTSTSAWAEASKWAMVAGCDVPWMLRTAAERWPDSTFLVWEPFTGSPASWTYTEFRSQVLAVAASLHQRGVTPGDRVLIHLDNSPEFLLSWFACAQLGAIAVSTNTHSVARDLEYFGEKVTPVAAITSPRFATLIRTSVPTATTFAVTANDAGEPADVPAGFEHVPFAELLASDGTPPARATDPAADLGIQFTSGTTSRPKAVLWTHANAVWGAQVNVSHMRLGHDDVTLAFLPLFHTNAQSYSMLSTLWVGGTMVLQPQFSASRFWDVSVRNRVTWSSMVPFCVKAILAQPVPAVHHYRFWGPAIRLADVERLLGISTMAWWGMTETITHGIVNSRERPGPNRGLGRPSPAYEISIRRPDGTPIDAGERGHLFIRGVPGVSMFKEYYGDAEATATAFDDDGWFDTGDIIVSDTDGNLFFGDRDKDMLKVGGENVAASEIELVVVEAGLAAECAVVGRPHEMLDEVPVIFVIPAAGAPTGDAALTDAVLAACTANLADFKVPRAVFVVDDLPRSTLNKIAKNELRARLAEIG
jgi:crotonobetaine/carnitine-CoA ligase